MGDAKQPTPTDAARHHSLRIVVLAPREIGLLVGVLVVGLALQPLGEVASARLVDARVAGLLALGEVSAMLLLGGLAGLLLARGEVTKVVVVIGVIMVIALVVVAVVVVVTGIVVGMLAHVP